MDLKKIAIFASGSGTNAQKIMEHFADNKSITIDSLWSNNQEAYALKRAADMGIKTFIFNRHQLYESAEVRQILHQRGIDLIVLAGFLWLIPETLIDDFTIINIHPALLPKYGGKGMYGMKVHREVINNGDKETGISIHYVDKKYDHGQIIYQAKCLVDINDTPEQVADKVHQLEYEYFPVVIERLLTGRVNNNYNHRDGVK
ncbi:MAG: phosphoribosylglycinamide formyltransferase [Prolixibacteraceae bacterium]|nr:phosphoribosylglycinamide formyltransferase [Prolixibacteraceae bacterium]